MKQLHKSVVVQFGRSQEGVRILLNLFVEGEIVNEPSRSSLRDIEQEGCPVTL